MSKTAEQRLWPKVDKNGPLPKHKPELGSCWLWTGYRRIDGYGEVHHGTTKEDRVKMRVHILAYELLIGPVADGLELHHRCENPACVNPTHLQPLTKSAHTRLHGKPLKTHCKRGHALVEGNLYRTGTLRVCRICDIARKRAYEVRKGLR